MDKKTKRKKRRIGIKIFFVILIILIAVAGYFLYQTNRNGGGMQGMLATIVGHSPEKLKDLDPLYFVVLGESVSGDSRLTDTIIVCKYDPKTQRAAMMSVPRDTYTGTGAREDATAYYKINNSYNMGNNPERTVKAINKITGLNIEYYVWVNTNVLKELVDAIGGVYFYVPKDMHYIDVTQKLYIDLKEGYQLLDGDKAEQVVRYRHDNSTRSNYGPTYSTEYGVEDYGRMRTQREFIAATLKQTLKPENILKVGTFLEIAYRNIKTNIPMDVLKDYIPYAVNFSTDNLRMDQLPGEDDYHTKDGTYLFFHYPQKTKELVDRLFLHPEQYDDEGNKIEETNTTNNAVTNNTVN